MGRRYIGRRPRNRELDQRVEFLGCQKLLRIEVTGNSRASESKLPTVVGPVKKSLPLTFAAGLVTRLAVKLDLSDVSSHCLPPPDLSKVLFGHSAANIISAVPLKPAARIVGVYPSVLPPYGQRLAGIDAEVVE